MMDLSKYSDEELKQIAGIGNNGGVSSLSDDELRKIAGVEAQPLSDERKAELQAQASKMLSDAGVDTSGWSVAKEGLKGTAKGLLGGLESVANGVTLGGYRWGADKLGLGATERKKELEDMGAGVPLGATDFVSGLATGGALFKGLGAAAKAIPTATKGMRALRGGAELVKYPLSGAIEGGLNAGFSGDSLEKAKEGAISGGVAGAVVPLALAGGKKIISSVAPKILGVTTGSGERAIKQAYSAGKRGSTEFVENMRGVKGKEDIVDIARNSLKDLKVAKNAEYTKAMSQIKGKEGVELKPIVDKFKQIANTEAGGKKYLVDDDTAKFLKKAGEKINAFAKDKGKKSLGDFDDLKQAIGNIKIENGAKRASQVQGELYGAIKDEIKKQAPMYDKIMKPYSQAAEKIRNVEKALSLGKGAEVDTTLRKLQSAFRNNVASNYGARGDLVNKLGNTQLSDAISGQLLGDWIPRGGLARLGGGLASANVLRGFTPSGLATLPAFVPRVVGEATYGLGKTASKLENYVPQDVKNAILMDVIGQLSRKGE